MSRPTIETTENKTILRALLNIKNQLNELNITDFLEMYKGSLKSAITYANTSTVILRTEKNDGTITEQNMPVVNSLQAGVVNPALYIAVQDNTQAIESLKGSTLTYPNMNNDLVSGMNTNLVNALFMAEYPKIEVRDGIIYQNIDNTYAYRFYVAIDSWQEMVPTTIRPFALEYSGTIKGSINDGQIYPELDGTGSVNGWDTVKADIAKNNIEKIYPVGSIYMSINATNPSTIFGFGAWERFGNGKVIVGVSEGEEEFNSVTKTGGTKTHTLSINEMQGHNHDVNSSGAHTHTTASSTLTGSVKTYGNNYNGRGVVQDATGLFSITDTDFTNRLATSTAGSNTQNVLNINATHSHNIASSGNHTHTTTITGGSQPHNNIQPYITAYMWLRTL